MKFLLLPNEPLIDLNLGGLILESTNRAELGGYFYDYFRNRDDRIVGVRCWLDDDALGEKSIFKSFCNDKRVSIHEEKHCVDVLFDSIHVSSLERNELKLDSAQDFGGMEVVQSGQTLGILFTL